MKVALPNIAGRLRSAERRLVRQLAQMEPVLPAASPAVPVVPPSTDVAGELAGIRATVDRLAAGMRELRDGLSLLPSLGALRRLEAERDELKADVGRFRQQVKNLQAELDRRRAEPARPGRASAIAARAV